MNGNARRGAPPDGRHRHGRRHRGAGCGRARSTPSATAVLRSQAAFQVEMATGRNLSGSAVPYLHPPTLTPTR
jgi:hypothetical protein